LQEGSRHGIDCKVKAIEESQSPVIYKPQRRAELSVGERGGAKLALIRQVVEDYEPFVRMRRTTGEEVTDRPVDGDNDIGLPA
jgi:hypothetical protein